MPARLFCKTGELAGAAYPIDREASIGRLDENQITLHPSYISGYHARIFFDDQEGRYFIEDLKSSNGTQLDGTPVSEPVRLDQLHVITFARQVDFIFQVTAETMAPAFDDTQGEVPISDDSREKTFVGDVFAPLPKLPDIPPAPPPDEAPDSTKMRDPFAAVPPPGELPDIAGKTTFRDAFAPLPDIPGLPSDAPSEPTHSDEEPAPEPGKDAASFTLVVTMPDGTLERFPLKEGKQVVGRESSCDLPIPDTSISRMHAQITVEGSTVTLEDLGSKNATFVDGKKLSEAVAVTPENTLRFGLSIEASLERS